MPRKNQDAARVGRLRAVVRGTRTPAVLGASRLFVLLVAARRWVLAGNTFWHARWDVLQQLHQHLQLRWRTNSSRTKISLKSTISDMMILRLSSKPISSALSREPVHMALGGKGFHPKAFLMK